MITCLRIEKNDKVQHIFDYMKNMESQRKSLNNSILQRAFSQKSERRGKKENTWSSKPRNERRRGLNSKEFQRI